MFTESATRTWVLKRDQPTREASMAKQTLLKYPFPKSLRDPLKRETAWKGARAATYAHANDSVVGGCRAKAIFYALRESTDEDRPNENPLLHRIIDEITLDTVLLENDLFAVDVFYAICDASHVADPTKGEDPEEKWENFKQLRQNETLDMYWRRGTEAFLAKEKGKTIEDVEKDTTLTRTLFDRVALGLKTAVCGGDQAVQYHRAFTVERNRQQAEISAADHPRKVLVLRDVFTMVMIPLERYYEGERLAAMTAKDAGHRQGVDDTDPGAPTKVADPPGGAATGRKAGRQGRNSRFDAAVAAAVAGQAAVVAAAASSAAGAPAPACAVDHAAAANPSMPAFDTFFNKPAGGAQTGNRRPPPARHPLGDLGHPNQETWTKDSWKSAAVSFPALIRCCASIPQFACCWPKDKNRSAPHVSNDYPKKDTTTDKWAVDSCRYCAFRALAPSGTHPDNLWFYGCGFGDHHPGFCSHIKRFLAEGGCPPQGVAGEKPSDEFQKFLRVCLVITEPRDPPTVAPPGLRN